jgi:hypothetical protein
VEKLFLLFRFDFHFNHALTTVKPVSANVVPAMSLAGGLVDGQRRLFQGIV